MTNRIQSTKWASTLLCYVYKWLSWWNKKWNDSQHQSKRIENLPLSSFCYFFFYQHPFVSFSNMIPTLPWLMQSFRVLLMSLFAYYSIIYLSPSIFPVFCEFVGLSTFFERIKFLIDSIFLIIIDRISCWHVVESFGIDMRKRTEKKQFYES